MITQVKPAPQRVPLHALVIGDVVFDARGGEHRITDIKTGSGPVSALVWIQCGDRPNVWEPIGFLDHEATIIPTLEGRQ